MEADHLMMDWMVQKSFRPMTPRSGLIIRHTIMEITLIFKGWVVQDAAECVESSTRFIPGPIFAREHEFDIAARWFFQHAGKTRDQFYSVQFANFISIGLRVHPDLSQVSAVLGRVSTRISKEILKEGFFWKLSLSRSADIGIGCSLSLDRWLRLSTDSPAQLSYL